MDEVFIFGGIVPDEVRRFVRVAAFVDEHDLWKKSLRVASRVSRKPQELPLTQEQWNELNDALMSHIKSKVSKQRRVSADVKYVVEEGKVLDVLVTGLYEIIRACVRQRLKMKICTEQLSHMKLPDSLSEILLKLLKKRISEEQTSISTTSKSIPHLKNIRWRVDVGISSSSLIRVFKPYVLLQLTLTNGHVHTVELSLEKFHELRYGVARVLKDMNDLTSHA